MCVYFPTCQVRVSRAFAKVQLLLPFYFFVLPSSFFPPSPLSFSFLLPSSLLLLFSSSAISS